MKMTRLVLAVSIIANVALGWLLISRSNKLASDRDAHEWSNERPLAPVRGQAPSAAPIASSDANLALRDRLRALGFSEHEVRAAVRARVEAPRLARQRALQTESANLPWWRVALPSADPVQENRELRELRKAERAELVRIFDPAGAVTRQEVELYAFLPEEKAARLAALERDYRELRREIPTGPAAPQTRAESAEREKLINAEYERDMAALLTPEERLEVERHTSFAAYTVADRARYFPATEQEYARLLELTKAHREASNMDGPPVPGNFQSRLEASKKHTEAVIALLGPERYQQWERASHDDYRALVALQRRFSPPPATAAALAALPREVGEEGMIIARDRSKKEEQQIAALHDLAARTREKIRALLGPDLGGAYNEAAARGWLDQLDRGMVPFFQENGQRAGFIVARQQFNPNAPPSRVTPPPKR